MKNVEPLIKKTEELIVCLNKTNNSTIKIYETLLQELKAITDDTTLENFLEGYPTSSKVMDFGGYNFEQMKIWEEVWNLAKTIRDNR